MQKNNIVGRNRTEHYLFYGKCKDLSGKEFERAVLATSVVNARRMVMRRGAEVLGCKENDIELTELRRLDGGEWTSVYPR